MQDHLDFTDNCCCIEMKLLAGKAYSNSGMSNQNIKAEQMSYSSIPAQLEMTRLISTFFLQKITLPVSCSPYRRRRKRSIPRFLTRNSLSGLNKWQVGF